MSKKKLADAMSEVKASQMSAEEEAEVFGDDPTPDPGQPDIPDWVNLPEGFKFPKGRIVSFIRLRADWTDTPHKGDRQCVLWNLNGGDEKLAITRSRGDSMRLVGELSKQMVRAVDGKKADWTGGKDQGGSIDVWWNDIGAKCRQLIQNHYVKSHTLTIEERADFLENCIVMRTAG